MINRDLLIINLKKSLRKINTEEILKIIVIKFFIDKIYKWCYNFSIILNILGVNYGLHFKSRYFRNRNCY